MHTNDLDNVELTYEEVVCQNKVLMQDLQQCLCDKDFVWNIWKEMQVINPNTVNIVNSVIEREHEKSNTKDSKVLKILQQKDKQINILQEISVDLQTQLKQCNERISELLIEQTDLHKKCEDFGEEFNHLKTEINNKDDLLITKNKQSADVENNTQGKIVELNKKINDLLKEKENKQQKISSLKDDLEIAVNENDDLRNQILSKDDNMLEFNVKLSTVCEEKQLLVAENESHNIIIKKLEERLWKMNKEYEDVTNYWNQQVKNNIQIIHEQSEKLEQHQQELLSLRKAFKGHTNCLEHIEEQTDFIQKLEKLQEESQNNLSQQQCTYQMEANLFKKTIQKLKKKIIQLQKEAEKSVPEKSEVVSQLRKFYPTETCNHDKKIDSLDNKFVEKCMQTSVSGYNLNIGKQNIGEFKLQLENIELFKDLVNSMEVELKTTRTAHKQRLQRYKILEENYHILEQQLATYEGNSILSPKKAVNIIRASSKSLQNEGSKSVWNELEFYRREYEQLKIEKPKLNEELEKCQVLKSQTETLFNKLKFDMSDLKILLQANEIEIAQKDKAFLVVSSEKKFFEDELECWKEKIKSMEKDYNELKNIYKSNLKKANISQQEIHSLTFEIQMLKNRFEPSVRDQVVQTSWHQDQLKTSNKEKEITDLLQNTMAFSETKLSKRNSLSVVKFCSATQTSPNKVKCQYMDHTTQTTEIYKSSLENESEKAQLQEERDRFSSESQQLFILNSKLKQENKNLKVKGLVFEKQVMELQANEKLMKTYTNELEYANEKLKTRLSEMLQKLQETTEILNCKVNEVEDYSQELNIALVNKQKGKIISKNKFMKLKYLEKELGEATTKCSNLTFQVKTVLGENKILTEKQKNFQARVAKLEKESIQKKTSIDELKIKCDDLRCEGNQNLEIIANLNVKLKTLTERDNNSKVCIEELNSKAANLIRDKSILEKSLSLLKVKNNSKTELLYDSQNLCHPAEAAISEIMHTAYKQIENEHTLFKNKNTKVTSQFNQCIQQVNEFKSVITKNSEELILKIQENQATILEREKENKKKLIGEKQNIWLKSKSGDISCSILRMPTTDLVEFMKEDFT